MAASTSPPRPPRPRGAARRAALLDATLAIVGERGADAVTHRAVAQRADLPLASTTYWFDSKEQLLTEALRHAADTNTIELREGRRQGARPPPPTTARRSATTRSSSVLLGADGAHEPGADRLPMLAGYSLMLEAARRPALQTIIEAWSRAYVETVGDLLRRAGSTRPAEDARLLMAARRRPAARSHRDRRRRRR